MKNSNGFTLMELAVTVVMALMIGALLLPALTQARTDEERAKCAANLRKIGAAMHSYAEDYGGWVPTAFSEGQTWATWLRGYRGGSVYLAADSKAWRCPSGENGRSYGLNGYHRFAAGRDWLKSDEIVDPSKYLLASDSRGANSYYVIPDEYQKANVFHGRMDYRHGGGCNVLFADGNVSWGDDWPRKAERPFWVVEKNPEYLEARRRQ